MAEGPRVLVIILFLKLDAVYVGMFTSSQFISCSLMVCTCFYMCVSLMEKFA